MYRYKTERQKYEKFAREEGEAVAKQKRTADESAEQKELSQSLQKQAVLAKRRYWELVGMIEKCAASLADQCLLCAVCSLLCVLCVLWLSPLLRSLCPLVFFLLFCSLPCSLPFALPCSLPFAHFSALFLALCTLLIFLLLLFALCSFLFSILRSL